MGLLGKPIHVLTMGHWVIQWQRTRLSLHSKTLLRISTWPTRGHRRGQHDMFTMSLKTFAE